MQFDHFWGKRVGQGGGNIDKIDQNIKLFFFLANLSNQTKSFDAAIDNPIAEVLATGRVLSKSQNPCHWTLRSNMPWWGSFFFASTYLPEHTVRKYYSTFSTSS